MWIRADLGAGDSGSVMLQLKAQTKSLLAIEASDSGCVLGLDGRSQRGSGRFEYRNHLEGSSKDAIRTESY